MFYSVLYLTHVTGTKKISANHVYKPIQIFCGVWLELEGNLKDNKVKIKSSGAGDNSHRQLCSQHISVEYVFSHW